MDRLHAFVRAQMRINAIFMGLFDEAGIATRKDIAQAIFQRIEDMPEGDEKQILRGTAQGWIDGLPPDLTVIPGGKDDA